MKILSSCDIWSHPEKSLESHLQQVVYRAVELYDSKILDYQGMDNVLRDILQIITCCHDFGKGTFFFQQYIREPQNPQYNNINKSHGLLSAHFTAFAIQKYLDNKKIDNKIGLYLPLIGYNIVKHHHGNIHLDLEQQTQEMGFSENADDRQLLKKQLENIYIDYLEEIYNNLFSKIELKPSIVEFVENFNSLLMKFRIKYGNLNETVNTLDFYFLHQLLYSLLLYSDKMDAAFDNKLFLNRMTIDPDIVDKYRAKKGFNCPENRFDEIRNEIYHKTIESLNSINLNDRIYSLNVPTGAGKTLTSLSFALKLKAKLLNEYNTNYKIIYALPFLSIIDQNSYVFEQVLSDEEGNLPPVSLLLKHHHLSDIFYNTLGNIEEDIINDDILKDLLLIEGWNSEIVVTTFIQFFHTLISSRNRSLMKFHNLANSIIILDEVQTLPHEYWLFLNKALLFLAEKFNTYIILVTATLPLLFDEQKNEIKPLIQNKEFYFNVLSRVNLILHESVINQEPIELSEFQKIVQEDIDSQPDKDFLIVLNTVNSSKSLYKYLKENVISEDNEFIYLSTNIVPQERLNRINKLKQEREAKKNDSTVKFKRKIIVSTQLIEAGVDISMDIVYRDIGPIDSINQVSGRCNRDFDPTKTGIVKLYYLTSNNKVLCKGIYDGFLINKTFESFDNTNEDGLIQEKDFLNIANKYFEKVRTNLAIDKSIDLLNIIQKLEFSKFREFQLIKDDRHLKADLFIQVDDKAINIWNKYTLIKDLSNPLERKAEFLKIRKDFYHYIISVYLSKLGYKPDSAIEVIDKAQLKTCYDQETGFEMKSSSLIC